jgi:hypothetical protein
LASGAGTLVDFGDSAALGAAICEYIEAPETLEQARTEARRLGETFQWPAIGEATAVVLRQAVAAAPRRPPIAVGGIDLPEARTDHLLSRRRLRHRPTRQRCDPEPRDRILRRRRRAPGGRRTRHRAPYWSGRAAVLYRSIAFLNDASDEGGAGMRNFMSYDRRWLDTPHVGDHVGRSILALGEVLATAWAPALVDPTQRLIETLLKSLDGEISHRTAAYATLGLARLDPDRLNDDGRTLLHRCVKEDANAENADNEGNWFEEALSYDNARLPQALLVGGAALGRPEAIELGLSSLAWFGDECGLAAGMLRLPGHLGRRRDEPAPGLGDEQPLDASALVEAELSAFAINGDRVHGGAREMRVRWFLGRNRLRRPLYDFATGGLLLRRLGEDDVNANEGANRRSHSTTHSLRLTQRAALVSHGSPLRGRSVNSFELFRRNPANPIITAADGGTRERRVQPGSGPARRRDGPPRPRRGTHRHRRIAVARSDDGASAAGGSTLTATAPVDDDTQTLGLEDPRTVWVEELNVISCTAYGPAGPTVFLATSDDFRSVERLGIVLPPRTRTRHCSRNGSAASGSCSIAPPRTFGDLSPGYLAVALGGHEELERAGDRDGPARGRVVGCVAHRYRAAAAQDGARMAAHLPRCEGDGRRIDLPDRSRAARSRRADARASPDGRMGARAVRVV